MKIFFINGNKEINLNYFLLLCILFNFRDIKKCYDSINPVKLIKILEETDILNDIYLINEYATFNRNKKPIEYLKKK